VTMANLHEIAVVAPHYAAWCKQIADDDWDMQGRYLTPDEVLVWIDYYGDTDQLLSVVAEAIFARGGPVIWRWLAILPDISYLVPIGEYEFGDADAAPSTFRLGSVVYIPVPIWLPPPDIILAGLLWYSLSRQSASNTEFVGRLVEFLQNGDDATEH